MTRLALLLLLPLAATSLRLGAPAAARRAWLRGAAAAAACVPVAALAESGEWAKQAAPALVPSPIRPTGEMAKTCEVVALGRDDVCLEAKPQLSAYDKRLLERALEESSPGPVRALLVTVYETSWDGCAAELAGGAADSLDKGAAGALKAACRSKDPAGAAKAVLKLAVRPKPK